MEKTIKWRLAQYLELIWWKRYLHKKSKSDYLAWKKGYWKGLLNRLPASMTIAPQSNILDAGCGPAGIFIALHEQHQLTAVDPLLDRYEAEVAHFSKSDYPNVDFKAKPIELLEGEETHQVVCCMNVINHVVDIKKSMDTLVRVLEKGGLFLLTIDAHNYAFFKHLFRTIPGDMLHPHQYDLQEYEDMMRKRGIVLKKSILIKEEFFFDHYMLVGVKM